METLETWVGDEWFWMVLVGLSYFFFVFGWVLDGFLLLFNAPL